MKKILLAKKTIIAIVVLSLALISVAAIIVVALKPSKSKYLLNACQTLNQTQWGSLNAIGFKELRSSVTQDIQQADNEKESQAKPFMNLLTLLDNAGSSMLLAGTSMMFEIGQGTGYGDPALIKVSSLDTEIARKTALQLCEEYKP